MAVPEYAGLRSEARQETPCRSPVCRLSAGDIVLFLVTAVELGLLIRVTPAFAVVDWIYVAQHLIVLGIAISRPAPKARDDSWRSTLAIVVAYAYPYAQVAYLRWVAGYSTSPEAGFVLVCIAACLSLTSLFTLGRLFGIRPAWRGLATAGPYRLVRHPLYFAYVVADVGLNLQEWNAGTLVLTTVGWASLIYRIRAEERILAHDPGWRDFVRAVPSRLIPGVW